MTDLVKIGKRIASLRKERGYTGEAFAKRLNVSSQAVSKWENGKCLPETALLPALAETLECSIDSLLCPRELFILEAIYTDGQTHIPVTRYINDRVRDNILDIYVNAPYIGAALESDRLKLLTVKYQTSEGVYFSYALQNENLVLDKKSTGFDSEQVFSIIGAYYGNGKEYSSAMQKMEHYEYFKWDKIAVNHETFPSNPASDDTEYLTLVYLNKDGIHVISCPENDTIYYGNHHTQLQLQDHSKCILKNVMRLSWEERADGRGQACPWAGALYASLAYMGETYTYEQIMGMSGACYRVCFVGVWDYSCTDALVAFDYAMPLFQAIGYSFRMVERLEKQERKAERQAIMEDIQNGRPVLAINLRVAAEWGIITGYTDNGGCFLCRTYFDQEIFDMLEQENEQNAADRRIVFQENEGYLFSDFWPFLILHFGEKEEKKPAADILKASLSILVESFFAQECRGYHQGKGAYEAWIKGLSRESDFLLESDRDNVLRRLEVNDSMLCNLIDARGAAAVWLRECILLVSDKEQEDLTRIADNFQTISDSLSAFRCKMHQSQTCQIRYNMQQAFGACTPALRREQIKLLEKAIVLEEENCRLAQRILQSEIFCRK